MKNRNELHTTTNSMIYNRIIKEYRARASEISCSICPYHRGCNHSRENWKHNNWKRYRKKQYKLAYKKDVDSTKYLQ